jgi:butyryl-CoA dehydrogenase
MNTTASPADTTDDRALLRDAALRYVQRDYGFDTRKLSAGRPEGFSRERWSTFAEMGWLALNIPEDCDGFGDATDASIVAQALGRANALEPWLANVGLCAPTLVACRAQAQADGALDRAAQAESLLRDLASGTRMLGLAAWESQGRHDAFDVRTTAQQRPDGHWQLDGTKTLVLGGAAADTLLVLARESGAPRDPHGLSLFAVAAESAGLTRRNWPTYDGRQCADVKLDRVSVQASARLAGPEHGWAIVETAIDHATALACTEAVGTMSRVLELTKDYLQQRRQFGRALTANQVIRHRLVDLYVAIEQARAISAAAVERLGDDPMRRRRAVSLAKAFVGPAARRCGEEGVQLHGAIGMTDETEIGQAAKRLTGFANLLGDEAWHLERLGVAAA